MIVVTWQAFIGYALIAISALYFYTNFLKPKFTRMKTALLCLGFNLICTWITARFFYLEAELKPFIFIVGMYPCMFILYKDTLYKMLIAPIIVVAIMIVSEIPIDYLLIFILKMDLKSIVQAPYYFSLQLLVIIIQFILSVLVIRLFKRGEKIFQRYGAMISIMSIQFFIAVTCVSQIQLMEGIHSSKPEKMKYLLVMLLISLIVYGFMLILIGRLYARVKLEISMHKFKELYGRLLEEYNKQDVNDEILRYLRHDLTNYIMNNKNTKH